MQGFLVVADIPELVGRRPPQTIKRDSADSERQGPKLLINLTTKSGIDEQVAVGMLHQRTRHRKVASLEQRAPAITKGRNSMVHTSHQRVDGYLLWRCSGEQRPRVRFWHRQR